MSSEIFNAALGVASRLFGKADCTFRPMRTLPNRDPEPDPARDVTGQLSPIFSEGAARVDLSNNGLGRSGVGIQSSFAGRYIRATLVAGSLPYAPRQGDILVEPSGRVLSVAEVLPDGLGGHILKMNEA